MPKRTGGYRLCVDLRPLNKYFPSISVKYETLKLLKFVPRDVCKALSLDLQDGYHHVRMHASIRPYFNFYFDGAYYSCLALPFGWSLAPAMFTRFLKPLIALVRAPALAPTADLILVREFFRGLIASLYLDDLLAMLRACDDPERASLALQEVYKYLGL